MKREEAELISLGAYGVQPARCRRRARRRLILAHRRQRQHLASVRAFWSNWSQRPETWEGDGNYRPTED